MPQRWNFVEERKTLRSTECRSQSQSRPHTKVRFAVSTQSPPVSLHSFQVRNDVFDLFRLQRVLKPRHSLRPCRSFSNDVTSPRLGFWSFHVTSQHERVGIFLSNSQWGQMTDGTPLHE